MRFTSFALAVATILTTSPLSGASDSHPPVNPVSGSKVTSTTTHSTSTIHSTSTSRSTSSSTAARHTFTPSPGPTSYETPHFTFDKLYNLTTNFWDAFLHPANVNQTLAINSTFFAPNVLGRVDVSRDFDGQELNTEYIFGLFSALKLNPDYFSLLGIPISCNIIHFTANENIVSVAAIVEFEFSLLGNLVSPVEIDVWLTFNADGQISQYDATFRRLDWQFTYLTTLATTLLGTGSAAATQVVLTKLLAKSICETSSLYCNGTNQQYSNSSACYDFLTQDVRFGESYELGMNTLVCRMVHQNMVVFRPDIHCPHIGPSGGGFCTDDLTYPGVVTEPVFLNTPMVPYGYANKNVTVAAM